VERIMILIVSINNLFQSSLRLVAFFSLGSLKKALWMHLF
jgi:hypothetical protein